MNAVTRRRLGAIAALVVGLFLGLSLLPSPPTGTVGGALGEWLWRLLGLGALGLPALGLALAWEGFDRSPDLGPGRVTPLVLGLALLAAYVAGVATQVGADDFAGDRAAWALGARLAGVLPGALASWVLARIGVVGGLLGAFLAGSALTLLTIGWHPLRRLEPRPAAEPGDGAPVPAPPAPTPAATGEDGDADAEVGEGPDAPPAPAARPAARRRPRPTLPPAAVQGDDELPPVALLNEPPPRASDADKAALDRLEQSLIETLRTFRVDASAGERTSGPTVTQFEIVPGPGVKAGRIVALADDIGITMRAPSVRVAPIPGRGAVGVEIPNPTARLVTLREILESEAWHASRAALPVALGEDLRGQPVIADLARMPHLLIAGATGTGKSVAINAIISSLVYRHTRETLRFLMVDPKMVELSIYRDLPHLRHPVITNNQHAASVLKWAVHEMNRRYQLLHANGARNIDDFNRKVAEGKPLRMPARPPVTLSTIASETESTPPAPPEPEVYAEGRLPFIVIVVDEFADLMMTVQSEVETPLAMLAQKARAIGIHIVLATQRPSVNVITGLIKANFPCRIAFRVASKVDSRTILDQNGAEALLGNGDMLFIPPGRSEPVRLQGAFIGTEETERVMHWFADRRERAAAAPARPESDILAEVRALEATEEGGGAADDAERDPLFREAAEACIQNQGGSTSLLQRKLRIGYGRAARIIDQLHAAGILGPPDGSRPRDVLIGLDQLDAYCD